MVRLLLTALVIGVVLGLIALLEFLGPIAFGVVCFAVFLAGMALQYRTGSG